MPKKPQHLLTLLELSNQELFSLLSLGARVKKTPGRWQKALAAADHVRDKFGESAIGLARGMKGGFRERVHENPAALPGKDAKKKPNI